VLATLEKCEKLVASWCKVVEDVVAASQQLRTEADNVGPHAELEHWKSRTATFNGLLEQMTCKATTSVIGVLNAGKSKVLERWRSVDVQVCLRACVLACSGSLTSTTSSSSSSPPLSLMPMPMPMTMPFIPYTTTSAIIIIIIITITTTIIIITIISADSTIIMNTAADPITTPIQPPPLRPPLAQPRPSLRR
jgi:hypothetical protein